MLWWMKVSIRRQFSAPQFGGGANDRAEQAFRPYVQVLRRVVRDSSRAPKRWATASDCLLR
jgi:hypothetical protein